MFTGIIKDLGVIKSLKKTDEGLQLQVQTNLSPENFERGASISLDGACMTVENFDAASRTFTVTAVPESLNKTNFSYYKEGEEINLEAPLKMNDALSGHFVSGHVDFAAEVISPAPDLELAIPEKYIKFFPRKGSVALNGVSLTIADSNENSLRVAIIPETMKVTNLSKLRKGWHVNVEIDLLARYLEKLKSEQNE